MQGVRGLGGVGNVGGRDQYVRALSQPECLGVLALAVEVRRPGDDVGELLQCYPSSAIS
jgi:hypothetical protein